MSQRDPFDNIDNRFDDMASISIDNFGKLLEFYPLARNLQIVGSSFSRFATQHHTPSPNQQWPWLRESR